MSDYDYGKIRAQISEMGGPTDPGDPPAVTFGLELRRTTTY